MAPAPHDWKAPRPLPLLARSRGRAAAALAGSVRSGAPTLTASRARDEGARARIFRGLRAAMHVLRDWVRLVGVALPCSPPAGSDFGATVPWATTARAGLRSPRGCARVSRRWQKSARSVRCPKKERGRGRARSEAPSRAASANRRTDTAARAATYERERFRARLAGGRCSLPASSCSPFTRWVEKAAWALRGGCRCKAGPVKRPGAPEARWANAAPAENA